MKPPQVESCSALTVAVLVSSSQGDLETPAPIIRPGLMFIRRDGEGEVSVDTSQGIWENTGPLWETMGMIADVVVLVIEEEINPLFLERLEKGIKQRRGASGGKNSQVVVVDNTKSSTRLSDDEFLANMRIASAAKLHQVKSHDIENKVLEFAQNIQVLSCEEDSILMPSSMEHLKRLLNGVYSGVTGQEQTQHNLLESEASESIGLSTPAVEISTTTQTFEELYEQLRTAILEAMSSDMDDLEEAIEQAMLDSGVVDFASFCNPMLEDLREGLEGLPKQFSGPILAEVGARLRGLWDQHMETLRDFYGSRYDALLSESQLEQWKDHAQTITEAFRKIAQDSQPILTRPGEVFRDLDLDYVASLQGLVSDMMAITNNHELERDESSLHDDDASGGVAEQTRERSKLERWCRKLAGRALVFGVNYLQGWLAWQGLKRAALERERNMPKFPLF